MPLKSRIKIAPKELVREEPTTGEYIDFPEVAASSPIKPNKQYYVEALSDGTMVGIHSARQYPTFFKLFQRYIAYHKLPLKLYIRQVKPDLWILLARDKSEPKPASMLVGDWREHGRYKWYAEQLEQGEMITVPTEDEATKARRAWMLYTPADKRIERDAHIEIRGRRYRVRVGERET